MKLAEKSTAPTTQSTHALTEPEAAALLADVPNWAVTGAGNNRRLHRRFTWPDFLTAMGFVNAVAEVAEAAAHHPDITVHYNVVDLTLWTHTIDGLSENDFIVAAQIDERCARTGGGAQPVDAGA